MAPLGENFRGNGGHVGCPLCHNHLDNQSSVFQCEEITKEIDIDMKIEDIYKEKITLRAAQKLTEMENKREALMEKNT